MPVSLVLPIQFMHFKKWGHVFQRWAPTLRTTNESKSAAGETPKECKLHTQK